MVPLKFYRKLSKRPTKQWIRSRMQHPLRQTCSHAITVNVHFRCVNCSTFIWPIMCATANSNAKCVRRGSSANTIWANMSSSTLAKSHFHALFVKKHFRDPHCCDVTKKSIRISPSSFVHFVSDRFYRKTNGRSTRKTIKRSVRTPAITVEKVLRSSRGWNGMR